MFVDEVTSLYKILIVYVVFTLMCVKCVAFRFFICIVFSLNANFICIRVLRYYALFADFLGNK